MTTSVGIDEKIDSAPSVPQATVARLARVSPAASAFSTEVAGRVPPEGNAVRKPGAPVPVAVTLTTTATTPGGMVPVAAAATVTVSPADIAGPWRLSSRRVGTTGWKAV